jgi:hypothetical protein
MGGPSACGGIVGVINSSPYKEKKDTKCYKCLGLETD